MELGPWIVEAALARMSSDSLTPAEQGEIVKATGGPDKVKWPEWWSVRP